MSSIGPKYSQPFRFLCEGTQRLNTTQEILFKILNNINHNLAVLSSRFNIFFHTENDYKMSWIWSDHDVKDLKINILQGKQKTIVQSKSSLSIFEKTLSKIFKNKEGQISIHVTKISEKDIKIKFLGLTDNERNILIRSFNSLKPSDKFKLAKKALTLFDRTISGSSSVKLIEARKNESNNNFKVALRQEKNLLIKSFNSLKPSGKPKLSRKELLLIDHAYSCTSSAKLIGAAKIKYNPISIVPKQECSLFKLDPTVFLSKITRLFFVKDFRETPFKIHYVEEEWEGDEGCSGEEILFGEEGNDANSIGEDYQYDEDYYENTHVIPAFNDLVIDESAHSDPEYMVMSYLRENLHGCGFEDSSGNDVDDLRNLRNMVHQLVQLAYECNNQLRDSLGPWGGRFAPKNKELKHLAHQLKFGRWTKQDEVVELIIKVLGLYETGYGKINKNEIKQTKEMISLNHQIVQEGYKLGLLDLSSGSDDTDSDDSSSDTVDLSEDDTFIPI